MLSGSSHYSQSLEGFARFQLRKMRRRRQKNSRLGQTLPNGDQLWHPIIRLFRAVAAQAHKWLLLRRYHGNQAGRFSGFTADVAPGPPDTDAWTVLVRRSARKSFRKSQLFPSAAKLSRWRSTFRWAESAVDPLRSGLGNNPELLMSPVQIISRSREVSLSSKRP